MLLNLENVYNRLINTKNCIITDSEKTYMNDTVVRILNQGYINTFDKKDIEFIVRICNLLYNNAPNVLPPLDDSLYDRLLVLCRKQGVDYPVGAPPIQFINIENCDKLESHDDTIKDVVSVVDRDKMLFYNDLISNSTPIMREDYEITHDNTLIEKKTRNVSHNYDMCGTLDKCNFVLNEDAREQGLFNDPSIGVFERDFLGKHIQQGIIDPNHIRLLLTLKYDGISVEATVKGDKIISACTRGDTDFNEASDLTPMLEGLVFPRATGKIDPNETVGIKFEFIITQQNLDRVYSDFGKSYVNPRNAVIGLTSGLDSRLYKGYLTPVPLESTIQIDRLSEVEILNKYYTKGIDLRHIVAEGTYVQVLYVIKKFVEEANDMRQYLNFCYDGIVVEYLDEDIRQKLGKNKSIPRYAIAIKFNPLKRQSTFTHYTYSVGQDGTITPMAHFKPVEFFGAIHNKTTIHSLARFVKLGLRVGDKVDLTLRNDVIVYLTKSDIQDKNDNPVEVFPNTCPSCGHKLLFTDSSAICTNFFCPERCIARVTNMLKKLNIKDFSTETIRTLEAKSLKDLLSYNKDYLVSRLGEVLAQKFMDRMIMIKECNYPDYRLVGSIGFTSIAVETWRTIFRHFTIQQLITCSDDDIDQLSLIKGIGNKTIETIKRERKYLQEDLMTILYDIKFTHEESSVNENKPKVRFTGVRDNKLAELFNNIDYDCGEGGVTKDTAILVVPYIGFNSNNTAKAFKYLTQKYNAMHDTNIQIDYSNLALCEQISPYILTLDQAYAYVSKFNI